MATWALILAGGEGRRLEQLTTVAGGRRIPKQFCSLAGGESLLEETVRRAEGVCDKAHVCAVVAAHHRHWWTRPLRRLPAENVVVQPEGRGTAHGILLPALHILARDPDATLIVLPSDHYVRDEAVLRRSMKRALAEASSHPQQLVLLGIQPDEADPELGYVVAGKALGERSSAVERFVEKPATAGEISELRLQGALWNSFIFAVAATGLLALYPARYRGHLAAMRGAVDQDRQANRRHATPAVYRTLPTVDFSREVLMGQEASLRLVRVPSCGWSDLGTPHRVARTLHRLQARHPGGQDHEPVAPPLILAEQIERYAQGARIEAR